MRPADRTFPAKTDAEVWLTRKEAEILNGERINPDAGRVTLAEFASVWIEERPGLRPKSAELCRYLLRQPGADFRQRGNRGHQRGAHPALA